ncbi:DUF1659 domain-containing protein [Priestia megaterium]|nr:DUF1659 domain-containing protein [Priestia megaterium]
MADKIHEKSQLRIVFQNGQNEEGAPVLKPKSYTNIQPGSSPDALLTAGEAIAGLQSLPLVEVTEVVTYVLVK